MITEGWLGYAGLVGHGYEHTIKTIKGSGMQAHQLLPRVHRAASLLKRGFLGTLQGGVQHRHLDLLSGRIHVSLQPPHVEITWGALLPLNEASSYDGCDAVSRLAGRRGKI